MAQRVDPTFATAGGYDRDATAPVSLVGLAGHVRRRWRVWVGAGAAGFLLAVLLAVMAPPPYSAAATLFLRHPDLAHIDGSRAMQTEVQLAMSRTVGERARSRIGDPFPLDAFMAAYSIRAASDEVMTITALGLSAAHAVARAAAVSDAYLEFRAAELDARAKTAAAALEERSSALRRELADLNQRINDLSAADPGAVSRQSGTLTDLLGRRSAVYDELSENSRQIRHTEIDTGLTARQSRVVDAAHPRPRSVKRAAAANAVAGGVAGAGLGMLGVLVREVASDKVRRREEVGAALGSSVTASVPRLARRPWWAYHVLRQLVAPRRQVSTVVRLLRRILVSQGSAGGRSLAVVAAGDERDAAAAAGAAAVQLVREGERVFVADLTRSGALARPLGVKRGAAGRVSVGGTEFWIASLAGAATRLGADALRARESSSVRLAVATLDPAEGAWRLAHWSSTAVVVVRAGKVSAQVLRSVSQMLAAAGIPVRTCVVVDPDRHDESVALPIAGPSRARAAAVPSER